MNQKMHEETKGNLKKQMEMLKAETTKQIQELQDVIEAFKDEKAKMENELAMQKLNAKKMQHDLEEKLRMSKEENNQLNQKIITLEMSLEEKTLMVSKMTKDFIFQEKKIKELNIDLVQKDETLKKASEELEKVRKMLEDSEKKAKELQMKVIPDLKKEIDDKETELSVLKEMVKSCKTIIRTKDVDIKKTRMRVSNLESENMNMKLKLDNRSTSLMTKRLESPKQTGLGNQYRIKNMKAVAQSHPDGKAFQSNPHSDSMSSGTNGKRSGKVILPKLRKETDSKADLLVTEAAVETKKQKETENTAQKNKGVEGPAKKGQPAQEKETKKEKGPKPIKKQEEIPKKEPVERKKNEEKDDNEEGGSGEELEEEPVKEESDSEELD